MDAVTHGRHRSAPRRAWPRRARARRPRRRFAKTTAAGLVVTRTIDVPGALVSLAWVGAEPVVQLEGGEVGRLSATGYEPYPAVPVARWAVPEPHAGDPDAPTGRFDTPRWRLVVDTAGAVWQARCDWGWDLPHGIAHHCVPEGGRCDAWGYARVSPGPLVVSQHAPTASYDSAAPPSVGRVRGRPARRWAG